MERICKDIETVVILVLRVFIYSSEDRDVFKKAKQTRSAEGVRLTETLWQGVAPSSVYLTHTARVALQFHPLSAAEYDAGPQTCPGFYIFQPTVEEQSGETAVYFWQTERHMQSTLQGLN